MSMRAFDLALGSFLNTVKEAHSKAVTDVAAVAMKSIVEFTPIDTSRARTNYVPSLDKPFIGEVPFEEGSRGSTAGSAATKTAVAMSAINAQYTFGRKIFIQNNVPYIEELEAGKSRTQAPKGMLKFAVQAIEMELKK